MDENFWWIVKTTFGGLAAFCGALAGWFGYLDILKGDNQENTKAWFRKKWEVISKSRWLTLPERVINWFLHFPGFLVRMGSLPFANDDRSSCFFFISGPVLLAIGCWIYWGSFWFAILAFGLFLFFSLIFWITKRTHEAKAVWFYRKVIIAIPIATTIIWTTILLNRNINSAAPLMLILSPFYWFALGLPLGLFVEKIIGGPTQTFLGMSLLFFLGISLGFTVTFLALLLGHFTAPDAYVPQTLQMLMSNVWFDGLTMIITFAILAWTISKNIMLRVPIAILLDLIAAAILACGSLFFGLLFTNHSLSIREVVNVLFAGTPDGINIELSPSFWVMHTTFIPTFIYLLLILLCWLAKAFLIPVRVFFGQGQEHKNPLRLTAGLCLFLVGIFSALSWGASAIEEKLEKAKQTTPVVYPQTQEK